MPALAPVDVNGSGRAIVGKVGPSALRHQPGDTEAGAVKRRREELISLVESAAIALGRGRREMEAVEDPGEPASLPMATSRTR
jgi:hypothetical protein